MQYNIVILIQKEFRNMVTTQSDIWYEKYRPQNVNDLILPEFLKAKLKEFIDRPFHLLLASTTPGTGKTSTVNAIIKEGGFESLFINASLDTGIDILRSKVQQFASTESINGKDKLVVLDECLEENEKILILKGGVEVPVKINELSKGKIYDCISLNLKSGEIENDTCEIVADKTAELYEVELEDGRKIKVTSNHPFIIRNGDSFVEKTIDSGLEVGDDVACREEISLPPYDGKTGIYNYIKKYNLKSSEDMYLKLHNMGEPPACIYCGKPCEFVEFNKGYREHCGFKNHKKEITLTALKRKGATEMKYDEFVLNNRELYENCEFPFVDPYDGKIVADRVSLTKRSASRLKILDVFRDCPICGARYTFNYFRNNSEYCKSPKCRRYAHLIGRFKCSGVPPSLIKLSIKTNYPHKLLEIYSKKYDLNQLELLILNRATIWNDIFLKRKPNSDKYSFLENEVVDGDMVETCAACGASYAKYDKVLVNGEVAKVQVGAKFTCGSLECYHKLLKTNKNLYYPQTAGAREKQSCAIKTKILAGEFTPCVKNSWTHHRFNHNGKNFRSSWELYYYVWWEARQISLEYETTRIPYFVEGNQKIYIVDFFNPSTKELVEIKPNSERTQRNFEFKASAANEFARKNGLKFLIVGDEWFYAHYNPALLESVNRMDREKILKLLKQFEGRK